MKKEIKTRGGVVYDLKLSPYIHEDKNMQFYFSSKLHMKRFLEKRNEERNILKYSLKRRFKCEIECDILSDLILYKKIETRGFLIYVFGEGGFITCLENIKLDGYEVTLKK
jgi:hypothetical protein